MNPNQSIKKIEKKRAVLATLRSAEAIEADVRANIGALARRERPLTTLRVTVHYLGMQPWVEVLVDHPTGTSTTAAAAAAAATTTISSEGSSSSSRVRAVRAVKAAAAAAAAAMDWTASWCL